MRSALLLGPALAASFMVTGCFTPRVKPQTSPAVLEARARAQAAKTATVDPCALYSFTTSDPVRIYFPYNKDELTEDSAEVLDHAAVWLECHPAVRVSIAAAHDNQGGPEGQKALIAARTAAVRARLVAHGVAAERLLGEDAQGEVLALRARGRGW